MAIGSFEIHDGRAATHIEEVFSDTQVARTAALLAGEVRESMLDGDAVWPT